jgi:lactoylglutathione lyase
MVDVHEQYPIAGPGKECEMSTLLQGNLKGLQHLGIPVTDLERSVEFYTRFGFRDVMRREIPTEDDTVKVAMMQKDSTTIEMYQLTGDELQEVRTRTDGHIDHIAFNVDDIDKAFAELKAAGMETIEDAPVFLNFWEKGCKYFAVRGPDGEKLEFNQII